MKRLLFFIFLLSSFLSADITVTDYCTSYVCTPAVDAAGEATENVVDSQDFSVYDYFDSVQGKSSSLHADITRLENGSCESYLYSIVNFSYYVESAYDANNNNVWVKKTVYNGRCYHSALNKIWDNELGANRDLVPADCSADDYLKSDTGTCEHADCASGEIPGSSYDQDAICIADPALIVEDPYSDTNTTDDVANDNVDNNSSSFVNEHEDVAPDTQSNQDSMLTGTQELNQNTYDSAGNLISTSTINLPIDNSGAAAVIEQLGQMSDRQHNDSDVINNNLNNIRSDAKNSAVHVQEEISRSSLLNHFDLLNLKTASDNVEATLSASAIQEHSDFSDLISSVRDINSSDDSSILNDIYDSLVTESNITQQKEDDKVDAESTDGQNSAITKIKDAMISMVEVEDILVNNSSTMSEISFDMFDNHYVLFDSNTISQDVWDSISAALKFLAIISAIITVFSTI